MQISFAAPASTIAAGSWVVAASEGRALTPAAVKADNGRNADARERGVFALRQLLRLAAADGFRHQRAPIERRYSPRILRHARLTISE